MRSFILLLIGLSGCRPAEKAPAPSRDSTPPANSTTPAAFVILSPKGSDTLTEGSTYVVRWNAPAGARINIGAVMGGKDKGHLLLDTPAVPDSFVWQIPVGFVTGFGIDASGNMRLRLEDAADPSHYFDTEPFTIVGSPK